MIARLTELPRAGKCKNPASSRSMKGDSNGAR